MEPGISSERKMDKGPDRISSSPGAQWSGRRVRGRPDSDENIRCGGGRSWRGRARFGRLRASGQLGLDGEVEKRKAELEAVSSRAGPAGYDGDSRRRRRPASGTAAVVRVRFSSWTSPSFNFFQKN